MAFTVKYFPHYDAYLQGERAARTWCGRSEATTSLPTSRTKVPIISPTVLQWTGASPWMDLVQRALTGRAGVSLLEVLMALAIFLLSVVVISQMVDSARAGPAASV